MDLKNFGVTVDPSTLPPPENNYEALPVGKYLVKVDKAEIKESKNVGNYYLNIKYSVIGADYTNRKIFEIINFKNSNEVAERIGMASLGELMRSLNTHTTDVDQFVGKNLYVKVRIDKDGKNQVTVHEAVEGLSAPSAPSAGSGKPPFFNKG